MSQARCGDQNVLLRALTTRPTTYQYQLYIILVELNIHNVQILLNNSIYDNKDFNMCQHPHSTVY